MHTGTIPAAIVVTPLPPELLLVDREDVTAGYISPLRDTYRVTSVDTIAAARRYLERAAPTMIVTELALPDGSGEQICRVAKEMRVPATVLVTTPEVEKVPDAIEAGCDAVLLKPFAPNLLFARVGRLVRARSTDLRGRGFRSRAKSDHLQHRSDIFLAGSNQHWPNTHCPHCLHQGVTSFEYTSYRRAWYACLSCHKVWLAKRQD